MGIKKLTNKGSCFNCGIKLIIPTWKWCELHDPTRQKGNTISAGEKKIYVPNIEIKHYSDVVKLYKFPFNVKPINLKDKNILLVDGFNIIGWK